MTDERIKPLSGTTVLIVEDEYYLADDLSRSLAMAGAQILGPVGTMEDAEARVGEGGFDFAIVDMNLRGDFAYSVAERLGGIGVPFIITTGYNQASLPQGLKDVPRVEKPFAPSEVVGLLTAMRQKVQLNG